MPARGRRAFLAEGDHVFGEERGAGRRARPRGPRRHSSVRSCLRDRRAAERGGEPELVATGEEHAGRLLEHLPDSRSSHSRTRVERQDPHLSARAREQLLVACGRWTAHFAAVGMTAMRRAAPAGRFRRTGAGSTRRRSCPRRRRSGRSSPAAAIVSRGRSHAGTSGNGVVRDARTARIGVGIRKESSAAAGTAESERRAVPSEPCGQRQAGARAPAFSQLSDLEHVLAHRHQDRAGDHGGRMEIRACLRVLVELHSPGDAAGLGFRGDRRRVQQRHAEHELNGGRPHRQARGAPRRPARTVPGCGDRRRRGAGDRAWPRGAEQAGEHDGPQRLDRGPSPAPTASQ